MQQELAGQAVVFVEQNVDSSIDNRQARWWDAYTGALDSVYLPLIMVDSGHQISNGPLADFYSTYKAMIMSEIARSPEAEIAAFVRRQGDALRVYVWLKNEAEESLLSSSNSATINAIVYEDVKLGLTSHTTRAVPSVPVTSTLAPGNAAMFTLDTDTLTGVNWDALHTIVVADYRPLAGRAFDMLQAAVAQPVGLYVMPTTLTFSVERSDPSSPATELSLAGPPVLSWSATSDADWLNVVPAAGTLPASPAVTIDTGRLLAGASVAHITLNAEGDDMTFSATVDVQVYFGSVRPRRHLVTPNP